MKPRQPYRSPFWRPDIADGPPVGAARPEAERRSKPAAPEQSHGYTANDLAMFGKLQAFRNQTTSAEPHRPAPKAATLRDPPPAPVRQAAAPVTPSGAYSSRDATLFQGLEASFASVSQAAAPRAASAPPAPTGRVYAQGDLDAFDQLAKFGRPA